MSDAPPLPTDAQVAGASANSLALLSGGGYIVRGDDTLEYQGERPGEQWHVHGWCERWLWILVAGSLRRVRLRKRRWLDPHTSTTCYSRPPDELGALYFCSLIVALKLWPWLSGGAGLHNTVDISDGSDAFDQRPSERILWW
jgi:hypothetical protein